MNNSITLQDLLNKLREYNPEEVEIVKRAYEYADNLHNGQFRQSGEPYISHPLNVAYILTDMHADRDTICASLLHDTLEDTIITKEDIAHDFNQNVASLVDGVTKLSKMNFSSKQDQNYANTRKIITGITEDVRIIIIKLADRLHNMRTLGFKSEFKQKENSLETMEIFVPLAYYIGDYRIKSELEDLSFQYLKPNIYKKIEERKIRLEESSNECLKEILYKIETLLPEERDKYLKELLTDEEYKVYEIFVISNKFNMVDFIDYLNRLIELNNPTVTVLVPNKNINYDYIDSKIKTKVSDNIYRGIKIIYKNKVYDFSLNEGNV